MSSDILENIFQVIFLQNTLNVVIDGKMGILKYKKRAAKIINVYYALLNLNMCDVV